MAFGKKVLPKTTRDSTVDGHWYADVVVCQIVAQSRIESAAIVCDRWKISFERLRQYTNKVNTDVTLRRVSDLAIDSLVDRWTTNAEEFMLVGFEKLTELIKECDDPAMIPVIANSMAVLNELVTSGRYLKMQRVRDGLESSVRDD